MKRIILLFLLLLPSVAFAQPKITLAKTKVVPGETLTIEYAFNGPAKTNAWIGIIPSSVPHGKESDNDANDVAYDYTHQPSGTITLQAPNTPGSYDLRWSGEGVELASVTFEVQAVDYKASLKLNKTSFKPEEPIDVNFSIAVPLPKNAWIGLIPSDVPHGSEEVNDQHDLNFQYLNDKTSGSFRFDAPSQPGSYDFRLNDSDSYGREIASVTFQVGTLKMEGSLKIARDVYAPGENIDVDFTTAEALPKSAWVGMIPSNVPHGKEEVNDQHDIQFNYLEGKTSGTLHFVAPPEPGSYDFRMNSTDSNGVEIISATFRVSGSLNADAMAKALEEKGKITLYGIQFDFNQATIKSESEAVLKEVGSLLQQQPDLKLRVQGHTDNVGKAGYNLELSKKRAESVKAYLVQNFQVDAARLQTEGFGDTKPIAKNDTEQGRAQNRRVELSKL